MALTTADTALRTSPGDDVKENLQPSFGPRKPGGVPVLVWGVEMDINHSPTAQPFCDGNALRLAPRIAMLGMLHLS